MQSLRDYQQKAVDYTIADIEREILRLLIVAPTASGKSHIIAGIIKERKGIVLCVTHSHHLVRQNAEKIRGVGITPSIWCSAIGPKEKRNRVIVASIQSLFRDVDLIQQADTIIVDECHRMSSASVQYGALIDNMREGVPLIGLTATPFRLGSGCLINGADPMFERVAYEIDIPYLIDKGYLCPISNRFPQADHNAYINRHKLTVRRGEYTTESIRDELSESKIAAQASLIIAAYKIMKRHQVIVFASSIAHANALAAQMNSLGMATTLAHSKMPWEDCERNVVAFSKGWYQAMINMEMLTTGYDHPPIDLLVLARPTKSASLYIQMVGRGMRISPDTNKTDLRVLDLAGVVDEHGPIDMPDIEGQESVSRGTSEPTEIDEEEVEAGFDGDSPEEVIIRNMRKEQDISLEVHQEIDILAGKPWDSLVKEDVRTGSFIRVGRATLRPAPTRSNGITLILQIYGRDARSGGKISCRQYFNFFVGSKYARRQARESFRHLFKIEDLPVFFYQEEGRPLSPAGYPLIDDKDFINSLDRRANEMLKFKLLKIINKQSGYPEMEQYELPNESITNPIENPEAIEEPA